MAQVSDYTSISSWTAVDLVHRFGAIPLHRVVDDPAPGTATVADVVRLDDQEDCLCELIDGTLLKKTMGYFESYLAFQIGMILNDFVTQSKLGIAAGADGMMQIFPDQVRIPDVSFISWEHLKDSGFPDNPIPHMAPTLAIEIISKSNTAIEMKRKLGECFEAGTQLVWYVYPQKREVMVYNSVTDVATLGETDTLTGGDVLPGLTIDLKTFFTLPTAGDAAKS